MVESIKISLPTDNRSTVGSVFLAKKAILMTRIFFTAIFLIALATTASAQQEMEDWRQQMREWQEQMHKMLERFGRDFGSNFFRFDTAFIQEFDRNSFRFDTSGVREFRFDSRDFPFDTAFIRGFRFEFPSDSEWKIDTFFQRDFRNFEPGEFFNGEWLRRLEEMMERLWRQLDNRPLPFDRRDEFFQYFPPQDGTLPPAKPEERPKKRKTTVL